MSVYVTEETTVTPTPSETKDGTEEDTVEISPLEGRVRHRSTGRPPKSEGRPVESSGHQQEGLSRDS